MPLTGNPIHQHGGYYREVTNFYTPWVPSPVPANALLDSPPSLENSIFPIRSPGSESNRIVLVDKPPAGVRLPSELERNTNVRRSRIARSLRRLFSLRRKTRRRDGDEDSVYDMISAGVEVEYPPERVTPNEWKAWGYYARPVIDGITVNNSPPPQPPTPLLSPQRLFLRLRSPGGTPHPELWVPGYTHPSLPPRPSRWKDPVPGQPQPFPWECQLNPFFTHHKYGRAPLTWNMSLAPRGAVTSLLGIVSYGRVGGRVCPLSEADLAQPATWPFLTHFYINALAEDPAPKFPWPVMVHNPRGVKVVDVLLGIWETFSQYVRVEEYTMWGEGRRAVARSVAEQRRALVEDEVVDRTRRSPMPREWDDGLNGERGMVDAAFGEVGIHRIDYMGQAVMFRGLEPSPDGEGWMLFTGSI